MTLLIFEVFKFFLSNVLSRRILTKLYVLTWFLHLYILILTKWTKNYKNLDILATTDQFWENSHAHILDCLNIFDGRGGVHGYANLGD